MLGTPEEIRLLGEVLKKELTHKQWDKHLMCFICLFGIIIVNLLRGSRKFSSIAGIKRCSPIDWIILSTFLVMCMIVSIVAIKKVVRDQNSCIVEVLHAQQMMILEIVIHVGIPDHKLVVV